jgi:hypothetical protein
MFKYFPFYKDKMCFNLYSIFKGKEEIEGVNFSYFGDNYFFSILEKTKWIPQFHSYKTNTVILALN